MAGPLRALLFQPANSSLAAGAAHAATANSSLASANSSLDSLIEPANSSLTNSSLAVLLEQANSSLANFSNATLANSSLANSGLASPAPLASPGLASSSLANSSLANSSSANGSAFPVNPPGHGPATSCLLWEGEGCDSLRDRGSCLGKRDGRPWASWDGLEIAGQPCAWCGGEECTVDGEALCMPYAWVAQRANVSVADCGASETAESVAKLVGTELAGWDAAHDSVQFEQDAPGFRCTAEHASDSASFNKFYWTFAAGSLAQCRGICSNKSYCKGFQYEDGRNECQVWWHAVQSMDPALGGSDSNFTCVRVAADGGAGDADENETTATTTHKGLTNAEKGIIGGTVGGVAAAGLVGGLLGGLLGATHTSTVTVTTTTLLVDALLSNHTENASAGLILPGTTLRGMLDGSPPSWLPGWLPAWAAQPKLLGGVAVALVAGALAALLAPWGRGRSGAKSRAVEVEVEVVSDEELQRCSPRDLEEGAAESLLADRNKAAWVAWSRRPAEPRRAQEPLESAALGGTWRSMFAGVFRRMPREGGGGQPMLLAASPQLRAGPLAAGSATWSPSPAFARVPLAEPSASPPVPPPIARAAPAFARVPLAEPSASPPVPPPIARAAPAFVRVPLAEPSASPPAPPPLAGAAPASTWASPPAAPPLARAPPMEPLASPPAPRPAWAAR